MRADRRPSSGCLSFFGLAIGGALVGAVAGSMMAASDTTAATVEGEPDW